MQPTTELTLAAGMDAYLRDMQDRAAELAHEFSKYGFVEIPGFGPPDVWAGVEREVERLLAERAQRRDVTVASTEDSPRRYEAISRNAIMEGSALIPAVYRSPEMMRLVAALASEPDVVPVPHEPEEILITRMTQAGDSHGWHWDDYTYSLIWMIQAPVEGEGAMLEFVPNTTWDKENPRIREHLDTHEIQRRQPARGSCYLLKADTALHRVAPLARDGIVRTIMVFTYASLADLEKDVSHESMLDVYPEEYEAA